MTVRGPLAFKILLTYFRNYPDAYKILNVGELAEDSSIMVSRNIIVHPEIPTYPMNKENRGLLVFINNIKFDDEKTYPIRDGADMDTQNIKKLFGVYHFEVDSFVRKNVTQAVRLNYY